MLSKNKIKNKNKKDTSLKFILNTPSKSEVTLRCGCKDGRKSSGRIRIIFSDPPDLLGLNALGLRTPPPFLETSEMN